MNDFDSECQYFNDEGFPRGCSGKRKKSSTFYWNQASLRKKKELCEKPKISKTIENVKNHHAMAKDVTYLTFQNIKKGMLLFGCISGIHPKKLIIDLPNSLSGAATTDSVRSMYDEVYIKQNKILLQPGSPKARLFQVGQLVVCSVLEIDDEAKSLKLSLDPEVVNSKFNINNLSCGMLISGWISAIGTTKIAVNVGIAGVQAVVCLSAAECKTKVEKGIIRLFQLMRFAVRDVNVPEKTLVLSFNLWLSNDKKPEATSCIYPGMIVDFEPQMEVFGGYHGKVGRLKACVLRMHLPQNELVQYARSLNRIKLEDRISFAKRRVVDRRKDDTKKTCVLFVSEGGTVVVSCNWEAALKDRIKLANVDEAKRKLQTATVVEYAPGLGLVCLVSNFNRFGILPHSCESDMAVTGAEMSVKVLGRSSLDDVLTLSTSNADYILQLHNHNVRCGEMVHAQVVEVTSIGIKVKIGRWEDERFDSFSLVSFIPNSHIAEHPVTCLNICFKPGDVLRCRVLAINVKLGVTALTMKEGLLDLKTPICTRMEMLRNHMVLKVFVKEIHPGWLLVGHFSDITGKIFISREHSLHIKVGQVILASVRCCPSKTKSLVLDFAGMQPQEPKPQPQNPTLFQLSQKVLNNEGRGNRKNTTPFPRVKVGKIVHLRVDEKIDDGLLVSFRGFSHQFFLPVYHLSDFITISKARYRLLKQSTLLVAKVVRKTPLLVTLKETIIKWPMIAPAVGESVPGFVSECFQDKVLVQLSNGMFGTCLKQNYSHSSLPEHSSYYITGQSVIAQVLNYSSRSEEINRLSLKDIKWEDSESRIERYCKAYTRLKSPDALKVGIGDVVNVESSANEDSGNCVVTEGKEAGYRGLFAVPRECRTGEAVILYIDHAEENLILSNRHEVVNFALKEEEVEPQSETEHQCVVCYVNCDITVAFIKASGADEGRLVCFVTFPHENIMFGIEKPSHEIGELVNVKIMKPIYPRGRVLMSQDASSQRKLITKVTLKRKKVETSKISAKKIKMDEVDFSSVQSVEEWEEVVERHSEKSLVWIRYMAHLISADRIDEARQVGQRAVACAMSKDEKVKIWMTLINLETYYGNDVTMQETLRGALNENDDQDGILNHLSKMCEDSGKYYKAIKLHDMTKQISLHDKDRSRFKDLKKLWMGYIQQQQEKCEKFSEKKLVERCQRANSSEALLGVRKIVAGIEFELGNIERGIDMYESIINDQPMCYNSWRMFINLMIKANRIQYARNLYNRSTSINFNSQERRAHRSAFAKFVANFGETKEDN